ncbi:M20 metallopeptidase family protein [Labedella endophytica]|uniref:Amidohydrolase n=1 Tax=Labedella endophytica TaxID=1523160 RepID=A0A3S0X8C0_9MICO|nr:M20 family metallopeptidase [Labedella endophytica]RUR01762.1 amidohydrolase [Labedella endophytica]
MPSLVGDPALLPDLVALRRRLHRDPEVGLQLPRTQALVLDALAGLGLEISTGSTCSSVTAVLRGGRPGPTVLLRADMDALPVAEATGLEYASTNGAMHACGHDLHTAGLVGAARLLAAAAREDLPGNVVFMFQPGEEGVDGAAHMIADGVLDASGERAIAAYGAHVIPGPAGRFSTRAGTMMAGTADLRITMHGAGGHGSQPHTAADPVPAVAELVTALQVMVTRRFSVFDPVVVTVTQLRGGDAVNVIPDAASLGASVRTLSRESDERLRVEVARLADGVAAAHGCRAEVVFEADYPVLVNDGAEADRAAAALTSVFGAERVVDRNEPLMASEDFSRVLLEVPGAFVFLAATPPDVDPVTAAWNHSAKVLFDDSVLGDLALGLATLASERLALAASS